MGKGVMNEKNNQLTWHRVATVDELPEGRVQQAENNDPKIIPSHLIMVWNIPKRCHKVQWIQCR
jgi:hypothetical protein